MEAAAGAARVEPAVCAAAAHLAIDDDTADPRAMPFMAVLAGQAGGLAGDVGEQGLDVAAAAEVELLVRAALLGEAAADLAGEALGQGALDVEIRVARLEGEYVSHLGRAVTLRGRLLLLLLRVGRQAVRGGVGAAHLGRGLVLVLVLVHELVLGMGLLGRVLGVRQALLHLLKLLLHADGTGGAAVGEDGGGGKVNMGR